MWTTGFRRQKCEHRVLAALERVEKAAAAPHHVRHREVHEERPQRGEHHHGAKAHALGERAVISAPA